MMVMKTVTFGWKKKKKKKKGKPTEALSSSSLTSFPPICELVEALRCWSESPEENRRPNTPLSSWYHDPLISGWCSLSTCWFRTTKSSLFLSSISVLSSIILQLFGNEQIRSKNIWKKKERTPHLSKNGTRIHHLYLSAPCFLTSKSCRSGSKIKYPCVKMTTPCRFLFLFFEHKKMDARMQDWPRCLHWKSGTWPTLISPFELFGAEGCPFQTFLGPVCMVAVPRNLKFKSALLDTLSPLSRLSHFLDQLLSTWWCSWNPQWGYLRPPYRPAFCFPAQTLPVTALSSASPHGRRSLQNQLCLYGTQIVNHKWVWRLKR